MQIYGANGLKLLKIQFLIKFMLIFSVENFIEIAKVIVSGTIVIVKSIASVLVTNHSQILTIFRISKGY